MITSASGWRKVFAASGDENDSFPDIGEENTAVVAYAADSFADYMLAKCGQGVSVIVGTDTRPTGSAIADTVLRVLLARGIAVSYTGAIAAPEIMAAARNADGFLYISASHNPIGHNGLKFGLNDGGVLTAEENAKLVKRFTDKLSSAESAADAAALTAACAEAELDWLYAEMHASKQRALIAYRDFAKAVITGTEDRTAQNKMLSGIRRAVCSRPIGVVCDMNGSARTLSLDGELLGDTGISFYAVNNAPGQIVHAIIPEPENLEWCAHEMERLHKEGKKEVILGYMPDCDGDRGNIVYWNDAAQKAEVLKAQEVFALSVLSELAYSVYQFNTKERHGLFGKTEQYISDSQFSSRKWSANLPEDFKLAVVANCPTSMRIDEIARAFHAELFRAEVGEANVVNLARKKREEGYIVRILGEGSNGGNITHPAAVRDPINTLFALIKLLVLQDTTSPTGKPVLGLFHLWCKASGQTDKYKKNFTLSDIIATLPAYTTTGVSEARALLKIRETNQLALKKRFQRIFEQGWESKTKIFKQKFGFASYEAVATVGTEEYRNIEDFSVSGTGGLKIIFYDEDKNPLAFMWMRGSKTEPVFRIMCDVKGDNPDVERGLLSWETELLSMADM
ncbi:MAG: phosphoglucomutase [Treponema sp.]|nr:phosphoglucomutase [Treponema sp.]